MTDLEVRPDGHGRLVVARPGDTPAPEYSLLDYAITEETAADLIAAVPANTERAYKWAWKQFADWCAETGRVILPATAQTLTEYVHLLTVTGLAPATISQALGAIRSVHRDAGYADQPDTTQPLRLLRDYRRDWAKGGNQVKKRTPILLPQLRQLVDSCDLGTPTGLRDRALLLLGFNLMARRSELAALDVPDVTEVPGEGAAVRIASSKTDQAAVGATVQVPYGQHEATCAVRAVQAWAALLADRGLAEGALFRPVDQHGHIGGEPLRAGTSAVRVTGRGIGKIVQKRAVIAQLGEGDWGPHGLRSGGATAAYAAGIPVSVIAKHGRWNERSPAVLGYIRTVDAWKNNPMKGIGL